MVEKEELIDLILNTPIERITGPDDVWEGHIDFEDKEVLVFGYKEKRVFVRRIWRKNVLPLIPGIGNCGILRPGN
jgi:hypothetical protein